MGELHDRGHHIRATIHPTISAIAAPKMIDTGVKPGAFEAIVVNLVLLSLFADQHSVMARRRSEQWSYREWVSRPFPWRKPT